MVRIDAQSQQQWIKRDLHNPGGRESKLFYRGYDLEVKHVVSGWRVGIYPRTADLPILSRCEVAALDQNEAVLMAKDRVDGVFSL